MLAFGGVEKTKEDVRDLSFGRLIESIGQDLRYGLRSLANHRAFSIAAVATLALGIGANSAIFSVVHGVLLQSLPYGGGDRLVRLRQDAPSAGVEDAGFSPLELADYRAATKSFDGLVEYHSMYFVLLGRAEPERVQTGVVSAEFFDVLGVQPLLGRTFRKGEDAHGAEAVLVLSYAHWMRSFGGDPAVVGRVFEMNDRPHTVIGVLPPIPGYPQENDVYMPVSACPFRSAARTESNRRARMTSVFGRLKPGVSLGAARAELATVSARLAAAHPDAYPPSGFLASAVSLREELTRQARPTFLVLLGTVGLILLLACANVANLSLARLIRRGREMAVRTALGADRRRLARQLLTETTLLGLAGGALGLLLARGGLRLLVSFATLHAARGRDPHRCADPDLHSRRFSGDRRRPWADPGPLAPQRPRLGAPRRRRPSHGWERAQPAAGGPDRLPGRDLLRARDCRRPDGAHALIAHAGVIQDRGVLKTAGGAMLLSPSPLSRARGVPPHPIAGHEALGSVPPVADS
jgi:predicted permease